MSFRVCILGVALALSATSASVARGQSQGSGSVLAIGYGLLSVSAIASLTRDRPAVSAAPGNSIRIRPQTPGGETVEGRLTQFDADSITLDTELGQRRMPRPNGANVQVNLGRAGRWAEGWGIGLLVGAAAGGALGYAVTDQQPTEYFTRGETAIIGAAVFGVLGSLGGAVLAAALGPDRWVEVHGFDATARVSLMPAIGPRSGFVARITF